MSQNHIAIRNNESLRQLPRAQESLRDETERTLGDIAYVLHLTRRVKQSIVEDLSHTMAK